MLTEVAAFIVVLLVFWCSWSRSQRSDFVRKINLLPGPPTIPVFGNAWSIISRNPVDLFTWIWEELCPLGLTVRVWLFNKAQIGIGRARDAEPILRSPKFITKSDSYNFLRPWLGDGLITADCDHWRKFRKIITPAFHFGILHEFLPIFVNHSLTMVRLLAEEPAATSEQGFDISHYSSRCAFDIICESAMGTKINAQLDKNAPYVRSVNCVLDLLFYRYTTPWLHPEITWNFSSAKKQMEKHVRYIDEFGDKVIAERREYLKTLERNRKDSKTGKRRGMAFLDQLLTSEEMENLSQDDIRSNVNVFMFAGYDTVATSMSWVLFLLGTYPDIQAKVVEELVEVFGDSGRVPDVADLANLKYLERCIKESLRLYPSVLFTERAIQEDVQLEKFLIPGGCTAMFYFYSLHRDPEFFPEPEKFDPDRFLPENSQGRHPYAYMPFSAGPRNCIGQKYALLEQKAVLSTVLRRFRIEAAQTREQLRLQVNIVLRPADGVKIRVFDRDSHRRLRVASEHI